MVSNERPDPDLLLRAIAKQEPTKATGKLYIFFGMSAGAGKTYAMLQAAGGKKADGVDVVIGLVETHGRTETVALTAGLEVISRKHVIYREATFEEMDLDALLKRRPQIAIVDELAHTNVPGSRHPKRWQDVVELLEAGIDVYTTLNVQHVESRKAIVEAIGGITVRETVPDALLEQAAQIELVDITPTDLLKRLSEGKVYLGEKAEAAAAGFFKEDRLTALRELALRLTAEKVDSDLHDLMSIRGGAETWRPADRLMVAVSHSPHSEGLVRATRRIAFGLGAPWIAVHIDTGDALSANDRATLAKNLRLVQELGGELVSITDTEIADTLERIARQRRVTQMVVGRPTHRWRDLLTGGSILDQLAKTDTGYDILVLRPEPGTDRVSTGYAAQAEHRFSLRPYVLACLTVTAVAGLSALALPLIGYKAVGFFFLMSVLIVSMFVTFGAVVVAALLSAATWDYFFIPPAMTLHIEQAEDVMMVFSYFVAALVTGLLAHRIRTRQQLIRQREDRTEMLYDLAKTLVAQSGVGAALAELAQKIRPILRGDLDLLLASRDLLDKRSILGAEWLQSDKERAVAMWSLEHGKRAGWATDTLPSAAATYLPLRTSSDIALGVLAYRPDRDRRLTQDEENLLSAVAHQLALSLERERLYSDARQAERLRESEQLLQTVIDSVSHELRTPLTSIAGTASSLASGEIASSPARRQELAGELLEMVERLNRIVGNLLDMSRLSSGAMTLQKDWHDPRDLVSAALDATRHEMRDREVKLQFDEHLPLVRVDFQLMAQAMANILSNAAAHTPEHTRVSIACRASQDRIRLAILDDGPGIAADVMPHLFTKFYRAPGAPTGGVGLGLPIAKAIVEAHGGTITVAAGTTQGACFVVELPTELQPEVPAESGSL
ncbi:MAG: sensor histidine kinase KdpD [candidate division Zixibacteria bacterium]|nr:sensor histidine kinase KdpD [candidate division Zixibacteria bacterium]